MTVYLGSSGAVELRRIAGQAIDATLLSGDVSVPKRRFSFSDYDIQGVFLTGDQVDIQVIGPGNLDLVAGHAFPDWRGYVFVDEMGGIRLYNEFTKSLSGVIEEAVELVTPWKASQGLKLRTRASEHHFIAEIKSYEIATDRSLVDTTVLGDAFRKKYDAGLISGQGSLNCFFEFQRNLCDSNGCDPGSEFSMYLAQLCIRLVQGCDFDGRFYIYRSPDARDGTPENNEASVWYEATCLVTNCVVNVAALNTIDCTINFVTTGRIKLQTGEPPSFLATRTQLRRTEYLLQEDGSSRVILAGQN